MNKTLRNKALACTSRLITGDMDGSDWACPDYFATAFPIYDGYKPRKYHTVPDMKPLLHKLMPECEYIPVDNITEKRNKEEMQQVVFSSNKIGIPSYTVQAIFYDLLINIYPNAVVKLPGDGNKYAPVKLFDDNKLVGLIMPLKA
jgi:hypothetical protein